MPDCLFCKVVAGEIPATRLLETARTLLVIPKPHYPDLAGLAAAGDGLLAEIVSQAHEVALSEGIAETGYRVVFNTGAHAGQTVAHVHAHVLGGRAMAWPPG